jgi:hypothetical protein
MRPIGKSGGLAQALASPARFEARAQDDEWEEVGTEMDTPAPFFVFANPGDALEGQLCPPRKVRDKDHYTLEDLHGKLWTLPDHARLSRKLALVDIGDVVKIVYEGEETFESRQFGNVTAKMYTVKRRKAASPDAAPATPSRSMAPGRRDPEDDDNVSF